MNAKVTATIAVAVVALMVFAAAGSTTYSWFSDSEETEINITTGAFEIDHTLVVGDCYNASATIPEGTDDISVSEIVSGSTATIKYTAKYKSNIPTVYRVYAQYEGNLVANELDNYKLNGSPLSSMNASSIITLIGWTPLSSTEGSEKDVLESPFDIVFSVGTDYEPTDVNVANSFKLTIKTEMYQGDYVASNIVDTEEVIDTYVQGIPVSIDLGNNVSDLTGKILTTSVTEESNGFKIGADSLMLSMSIDGGSYNFDESVVVSVTIPGNHATSKVTYVSGEEYQDMGATAEYDSDKDITVITFSTNHFSDFMVTCDHSSYTVSNFNALKYAAENLGGNIIIGSDINVTETILFKKDAELDLAGKTIKESNFTGSEFPLIRVLAKVNVTGNGTISAENRYPFIVGNVSVDENSVSLTIDNGSFNGNTTVVSVTKGTLVINGGIYTATEYKINDATEADHRYTINCIDANYRAGTAVVKILGGEFFKFNPANNKAEGESTNFVGEGILVTENEDNYFEAVPAVAKVKNVNENEYRYILNVQNAINDTNIDEIVLFKGEFKIDLYNINPRESLKITGQGADTNLSFTNQQVRLEQFDSLTIENCEIMHMHTKSWGHLVFSESKNANGVYTVSNCVFNGVGTQGIYINENVSGATYNIKNCTFNDNFGGEGAITIQNNDNVNVTVNVTGCTFNNIPETSHKIYMIYAYDGFTLNAEGIEQYWKANQTSQ